MTTIFRSLGVLLVTASLAVSPVFAQGQGHGKDKGDKHEEKAERKAEKAERKAEKEHFKAERKADKEYAKAERKAAKREDIRVGTYFNDSHRTVVRTYYTDHYSGGKACPPGLAKKNNGCMPPGQARKYVVGQPLRVSYYAVPQPVLVTLPPAPVGYRYVTVNGDILLIAITTRIVVDALSGLLR
ncbi:MAG: RcnB family protein [Burkholderiales bacterium]|nr:RcnB family protein [Burkholderiales bacterium]